MHFMNGMCSLVSLCVQHMQVIAWQHGQVAVHVKVVSLGKSTTKHYNSLDHCHHFFGTNTHTHTHLVLLYCTKFLHMYICSTHFL